MESYRFAEQKDECRYGDRKLAFPLYNMMNRFSTGFFYLRLQLLILCMVLRSSAGELYDNKIFFWKGL